MDGIPVTGIFATHLHEMFDLPLRTSHVAYKRMGYTTTQGGPSVWTYRLEDGRCAAHSINLLTDHRCYRFSVGCVPSSSLSCGGV